MSAHRRLRRSIARAQGITPGQRPLNRVLELGDSLVGRINAYHCDDCGGYTVTRDRDPGVTPMFLGCRATDGCGGRAVSMGYPNGPKPDHIGPVRWEWYRPQPGDPLLEDPEMADYCARGGLALRPLLRPVP